LGHKNLTFFETFLTLTRLYGSENDMIVSKKYLFIVVLILIGIQPISAQYSCKKEYRVMNKQKKKVKKQTKIQADQWLVKHADSLHLPSDLKLSKLKFLAETKEEKLWISVDSLICLKSTPETIDAAKKLMLDRNLVVFDIRATFSYTNSDNPLIKSVLNFEYDFNGKLIRAVIRKKEKSPFSETPFRNKKK
jgi:hypothetical protein